MASTKTHSPAPVAKTDNSNTDAPAAKATEEKAPKAPRFPALPADRAAWIAANARPAVSSCLCGCGGTTKGRFVPGHDATLKESLKTGAAAGCESSKAALTTFGW